MRSLTVHVLFYREEDRYVAHCLEFDLVAQGESIKDSYKNLLDAIELQTDYASETHNFENLINPAPTEYWRMLVKAESDTEMFAGMELPEIVSNIDCSVLHSEQRYG
jgi:predicted RNase H-like HicB family nuclease